MTADAGRSRTTNDGATVVEEWVVLWFPPEGDRDKRFTDEAKARRFARREDVAEWNPLLDHRVTTTTVKSEFVPLDLTDASRQTKLSDPAGTVGR